ncbi:MAG: DUF3047 domain-containing protein [Alphaproteobacteria bacterium]|nr:DUF3047 domain-containing protein [Alphaproteobacteria bacterium]
MSQIKKAPSGAGTFLRFAWQQLANRKAIQETFGNASSTDALAQRLRSDPNTRTLKLSATDSWTRSGLILSKGEHFSVYADGAVWISKPLSVGATPVTALWLRIGNQAPIQKIPAATATIEAWADGELEFCLKPPGEWASERGDFDSSVPRTGATGTVDIIVAKDAGEKQALQSRKPGGWSYLWRLGDGSIYEAAQCDGKPCIHVHTHGDVGILQYPVEIPLDDSATLEWRWCVDRLPSNLPEHIQPTHDYLSMAVEFDNGQDLTYYWSSELPVDTVFKCPLPWWDKRETHWVVRSGRDGLGQWQSEKRQLKPDYAQAIGGALPAKIVRVWLIANSVFQRRHGDAKFADIAISAAGVRKVIV